MTSGDPGLLVNLLLPNHNKIEKQYKVGIVSHYKDADSPAIKELKTILGEVLIIDIFSETYDFLEKIAACEFIFSSSLHGLVTADAFDIPNTWLKLSDNLRGGSFKFLDYYSVFGLAPKPVLPEQVNTTLIQTIRGNYSREGIMNVKQNLIQSFPFLRAA